MKSYLQQITYASLTWLLAFITDSGIELFQIYNDTRTTLMGLQIQNIDTKETVTNFFSLTPRFYFIYLAVVFIWLSIYSLNRKYRVHA
ncbi:hypothetical protein HMPREF9182_1031 [Streptococcus sp. oral taxon 056 str. F0418]|uniref:hypothetical protein n=1 Tax=Streptococcus sp. oral taxon 056 TaxID=712620 RepID=UPI00021813EE|nr:hypothetical protein [Streptococcus sp. oral taxon 056]EGP66329.1 hypothetical protein HMPREF9182_1031 [Streptococcus sp. oral taxon 056 str. F0418]